MPTDSDGDEYAWSDPFADFVDPRPRTHFTGTVRPVLAEGGEIHGDSGDTIILLRTQRVMTPTDFWALRVLIAYACHDHAITHQDHKALQVTAAHMFVG